MGFLIILVHIGLFQVFSTDFSTCDVSSVKLLSDFEFIDEENRDENALNNLGNSLLMETYFTTWEKISESTDLTTLINMKKRTVISANSDIKITNGTIDMIIGLNPTICQNENYFANLKFSYEEVKKKVEKLDALVVSVPVLSLKSFYNQWASLEEVRYLEPSLAYSIDLTPNDPNWSSQWGPQKIQAALAWDIQMGNPSEVLVAVIDTGIDYTHPDLSFQYVPLGYDWVNDDDDPMDDHSHGTHCAGTIAATINNNIGIAGIADVQIMAEKFLNADGSGSDFDAANAIIHAVDQGAAILSNSWGGSSFSTILKDAIAYAAAHDVIIVAAAGNSASTADHYPSSFPEVISVSATDINDELASFSNYGSTIELSAPGVNIYSTIPVEMGSYASYSGTSMAAPHVSGVCALILSEFPMWNAEQIRSHLRYKTDDLGEPNWDQYYGYGRLNANKSVHPPPMHDLYIGLELPKILLSNRTSLINASVCNRGQSNETNVELQLWINNFLVDSQIYPEVQSQTSKILQYSFTPVITGKHNITAYIIPIPNEETSNNVLTKFIRAIDVYNYEMEVGAAYSWIDATNGIKLPLENDRTTTVDFPFPFQFYDQYFSKVYVSSNGWLSFNNTNPSDWGNPSFPSINPKHYYAVALFWDDLLAGHHEGSEVYFLTLANPNRAVIEYHDIRYTNSKLAGNFEVIFYENGDILFQYDYISTIISYTIGLNFGLDPRFFNIYDGITTTTNDLAILFTNDQQNRDHHDTAITLEAPSFLQSNETTIINVTASNHGSFDETNIELQLWINNILKKNHSYPNFKVGAVKTLSYTWTPTEKGIYNVTAYIVPVKEETLIFNNHDEISVKVDLGGEPNGRKILFDEAHLPAYSIGSNPSYDVDGGYSEFANLLIVGGYNVETIDPNTIIDSSVLSEADILVIVCSQNAYTVSELDSIEKWVKEGGSLLVVTDWGVHGYQMDTIIARFGLDFSNDLLNDSDDHIIPGKTTWIAFEDLNLQSHSITLGISRIEMYSADGLVSNPIEITPIIMSDSDGTSTWKNGTIASSINLMSILEGGSASAGKICVIGDTNLWDNAYDADSDGNLNFYDSDNEILAWNTIDWLGVILDDKPPEFTFTPSNFTYTEGTTGYTLNWIAVDPHPGSYLITRNESKISGNLWYSGIPITLNIDGLTIGTYIFNCTVFDEMRNPISHIITVIVVDNTLPIFIIIPENFQYSEGTIGHTIGWMAADTNPSAYTIYKNGTLVDIGTWASKSPIVISIDGLTIGKYYFTLVISDLFGNSAMDTVLVTVVNTVIPYLVDLVDITYEEGTIGHKISWIATDADPNTYTLHKDGLIVDTGSWLSDSPITINVDGLPVGSYNYTLVVADLSGNFAKDTVIVTVITSMIPFLTSPMDITYEEGTIGHAIYWTATDTNPNIYTIYQNGTKVETGSWLSVTPIIIIIDGLTIGIYNYTIAVTDTSSNLVIDTVTVKVIDAALQQFSNSTDNIYEKEVGNRDEPTNKGEGTKTWFILALVSSVGTGTGIFILKRVKNGNTIQSKPNLQDFFQSNDSTEQFLEETGINKQITQLEQKIMKLKKQNIY